MAEAVCDKVWRQLRQLRDLPPLPRDGGSYEDFRSFVACNEVRSTLGPCAELPRNQFLAVFACLAAGTRLEELVQLLGASRQHPALQYACLLALHGIAELSDRRVDMLTHRELVHELLTTISSPQQRVITPSSAGAGSTQADFVNPAAVSVSVMTGLFSSNGTLEPEYAKLWVDLGAVQALIYCLESHKTFDRGDPVATDLPLCFFLISTSLFAGAADAISDSDKLSLGTAWLQLFVDAREWIAHEAGQVLISFYTRPNWVGGVVHKIAQGLRVRALEAAQRCEAEGGSWSADSVHQFASALRCANARHPDQCRSTTRRRCARASCVHAEGGDGHEEWGRVDEDGDLGRAARLKRCSRCRSVFYCSRECQLTHWRAGHREACALAPAQS
ncbi:unnamed protein product [Ascophyllum nodosum]